MRFKKLYIEDCLTDTPTTCEKCGKEAVAEVYLSDDSTLAICTECNHCSTLFTKQDLYEQIEGVNDTKNCYVGYKGYILTTALDDCIREFIKIGFSFQYWEKDKELELYLIDEYNTYAGKIVFNLKDKDVHSEMSLDKNLVELVLKTLKAMEEYDESN